MKAGRILRNPDAPRTPPRPRAGRDLDRADEERLEEIRQYFKDQYARREAVARTTTADGDELDWVPADCRGEPPDVEPPERPYDSDRPGLSQPFESPDPDAETGPPGTVPMLRKPLDRITPVGTLQDYLAKGSYAKRTTPPDDLGFTSPAAAPDVHKYAHARQPVFHYGTEGVINTWRPYVQWSNEFSLGQLWVVGGSGVGTDVQTVEVGVQTYYDLYGDWYPHLFIFYTTNNYTQSGDYLGGYNRDVKGWEQLSSTVYPGIRMAESVYGGDQYELSIKVMLYLDKWWVRIGNEWMGGYPRSLFNASGLYNQAGVVDWGGEIDDDLVHHPEATWTQMGSGHFPYEGWSHAAYMRNMAYQSDAAGTMQPLVGYPSQTNPNAYQIAADFSGTTTWGSNFYWGGPGGVE
ncbi:neprosin family prolyl endopeptidase [Streptomyces sp. NPDC002164]|uniref:neprosin family prolyl endopeptidase n=1 Tax=Streptomyces sp. NPDC002164 TaxID=3364633 RepID=UPI00368DCF52